MSAPIDDLLYGGDDSGDDDDLNSVPMSSFSAPLPSSSAIPMAVLPNAAPLGAPSAVLSAPLSAPLAMNPASVSAPVSSMASAPTSAALPLGSQRPLGGPAAAAPAPAKQPGSGHQMFQQMFALLKQMLPPEQYAALHSEMRNGNGNDIKSIVDIIKRIAGDAIFASVIQKMDLTRNHSAAAGSLGIVKAEPGAPSVGLSAASNTSAAPAARPLATPPPSLATSTPLTQSAPIPMSQPISASPPAAIAAPSAPVAIQRPTITATTPPPAVAPQVTAPMTSSIKAEPLSAPMATMTPPMTAAAAPAPVTPTSAAQTAAASTAAASAASAGANGGKADTQEKIEFAKKLLFHASTCTLPPGICTVKRCDDVRRVFKHSVSCGGARGCSHCKQLKALVEYHAKECLVPVGEHCKIPFCDGIRRNNATARARAATTGIAPSIGTSTTTPTPSTATPPTTTPSTVSTTAPPSSVLSDDDEDNTPLASAVTKVKNKSKAKSPKTTPAATPGGSSTTASKKKTASSASSKPSTPAVSSNVSTPSSTGSSTPANATATAAAAANKAKPVSAALAQAQEYGRLLQLILHVETCKTSTCPVGEDCVESKALLRQINSPDAPARAQTYKKVYAHYKVCVAKKTTQTCPMCKIGLMPLDLTGGSTGSSTSTTTSTTTTTASSSSTTNSTTMSPAVTPAVPATSPSVASLKRSNSSLASPRSPSKKPRVTAKGGKASAESTTAASTASAAVEQPSSDLVSTSRTDLRKEEDVLTHTQIDLNAERRIMMDGSRRKHMLERLPCQKEAWIQNDLFTNEKLTRHMERVAKKHGVTLGGSQAASRATQVMAHALQEYLKQVMEEMVEAARLRGDVNAQVLDHLVKKEMGAGLGGAAMPRELTSTDILRVSCDDSFARLRQEDLALRARLLEDAKREELAEKERAKKRKKVDRVKMQAQEEKDEAEMDVEELAVKDLKERLLQEDKDGVVHVDGRVNESLTSKYVRRVDDQVTMEDATYWLENQKPFLHPKLFVRAEAARIVTKSLL